ncbi:DUF3017 domain-containing protein [Nocardioides sp. JQ2195]|uniref:DUF3017 domain-containing protein n=1 Tax=Nocardioides sp. JQ2195 TaxID=2592334 RepID=UPI00143E9A41|nr:DUF3017 domain-containing protein [Nocardioides sp. JQ2195]QIX25858.1 DUF3017 domain-containing protein [Nocardioides sp. JQ2195]
MTERGEASDRPDPEADGSPRPGAEEPLARIDPNDVVPVKVDASDPAGLRSVTEIRKPSTLGGVVYLAVLAAALIGVVVAATGAWRTGVSWLALALLVAAGTRLALPDDDAGMLQVRRKFFDAVVLIGMGVVLLVLVATIPDQPS